MSTVFLFGVMKKLWNHIIVTVTQLSEYTKTLELSTVKGYIIILRRNNKKLLEKK